MIFFNSRKHFRFGVSPFGKRLEGYRFTDSSAERAKYTYTDEWFSKKMAEKAAFRRRLLYYCLSAVGIALMIIAGIPTSQINRSNFIGLITTISIIMAFWLIYILITMAINKNRLTVWAFRVTALQVLIVCTVLSVTSLLSVLFTFFYIILYDSSTLSVDIPGLIMRLVEFAAFLTMVLLEYNTEYDAEFIE